MAIVKANYTVRGKVASRTAKQISHAAHYYTYRDGPDRVGRVWYAKDGRSGPYDAFKSEIYAHAKTHLYSYRVVLSTSAADLGPGGYHAVIGERFSQYYFVEHHNTAYPHAHVIGYTATKLSRSDLNAMRAQVKTLEQARAQEWTQHADASLEWSTPTERTATPDVSMSSDLPGTQPTRQRSRGRGLD